MESVNTKYLLIVAVSIFFFGCKENEGVLFEYPHSLILEKNSETIFYIKVKNNVEENFVIDNVGTSCHCLVAELKLPHEVKSGELDSIKIKFLANQEKKGIETLIITHNMNGRFKKLSIDYEIY